MAREPREKTIPVQARIPESHVAVMDEAVEKADLPTTRSAIVAQAVKEWVERRRANGSKPKPRK